MHTTTRRILALALLICLALTAVPSLGEAGFPRWAEVYDTSGDAGFLTARFVWLGAFRDDYSPGDCIIVTSPDGLVMVIDSGLPSAWPFVTAALEQMGITRIDYLVASHPHIDHIGTFDELIRTYDIGAVYTSAVVYPTSNTYLSCMAAIADTGVPHHIVANGDSFAFGEFVTADVLWPEREIPYYKGYPEGDQRTPFINNNSMVLRLTYGEGVMLFSGDLYTPGERDVVEAHPGELLCDVAKINHHGSGTSSGKAWRDATMPRVAVAQSDGIPDMNVLKKYVKLGEMRQTLLDGDVRVRLGADDSIDILTAKDRTTDMFD